MKALFGFLMSAGLIAGAIAGAIAVVLNFLYFFDSGRATWAILRIMIPKNAHMPSFWINMTSYCMLSGDLHCPKTKIFLPRYEIPDLPKVYAEALTAANPSYFITLGTLFCLILSALSLFSTSYALLIVNAPWNALDKGIMIGSGISVFLSFAGGIGIYIAFRFSLQKVASTFKDIPDTNITWCTAMPVCWSISFGISILMLLQVWWRSRRRPEPPDMPPGVPPGVPPDMELQNVSPPYREVAGTKRAYA